MDGLRLTGLGLTAGIWEARIEGAGGEPPALEVSHRGEALPGVELRAEGGGAWLLRVPVPVGTLGDGMQTYLVTESGSGVRLGSFAIVAGAALDDDLAAELALLRSELEVLKKALRRIASAARG